MHIYRRCLRRLNIDSVLIIIGCFGLFSVQYTCSSTTLVKLTRMQFVSVFNQFYFPLNWLELLFIVLHHLILFIDVFQLSVSCVYVFFWNIQSLFLDISDVLCTILNTFPPKFRIFWTLRPPLVRVKFSGSGRVRWVKRDSFSLSLNCLTLVSRCQWRKARHRCDGGTCHSYCEFLFLCSFSLFIVLNIGSHGNHSNSKTGGCIDVEDNDDDHDDDAINGGGEKKSKNFEVFSQFCSGPGRGLSFTLIQLFLSTLSFLFSVFLTSFLSFVMFL